MRTVSLERLSKGRLRATNVRGGTLDINTGEGSEFTPVELLLVAIGGCTGIDVDLITSKRSEPTSLNITVNAEKVRDSNGNHLSDIEIVFQVSFPLSEDGDAAREVLPDAVKKSHERLCTVGRTVQLPTPMSSVIA